MPIQQSLDGELTAGRFWEALSGICSRTIQHPDSQVNRLCISPDKRFLAAAGRHSVKLYDIKSTNPSAVLTFEGHTGNITGVGFHCEGKWMVTSSEDNTVKIWDTRSGSIQRNYNCGSPATDVVIHPNQGELISGDREGAVRIWDLGESKCTHQLIPEEDVAVSSVTVASDGTLLCAGNNHVRHDGGWVWLTLILCLGKRLRLADDPRTRCHLARTRHPLPGPSPIHHSHLAVPRRASSGNMLSRSHGQDLVGRPARRAQSVRRRGEHDVDDDAAHWNER